MEGRSNNYMGGIRPNKEDPIICSFTNNAAIWMAFFTPGLEHMQGNINIIYPMYWRNQRQTSYYHYTRILSFTIKHEIFSHEITWNRSDSSKCPGITIHDAGIAFHMPVFRQIGTSASIGAWIILHWVFMVK